jgi:flagellar motility protein MotE (MotC chaperone)
MIGRLAELRFPRVRLFQVRLRLVDAVAIAATAVLGLKLAGFLAAPPVPGAPASGVVPGSEQVPPFFRAIANARSNYVAPDVTMTGAVPDKKPEAAKPPPSPEAPAEDPRTKRPAAEPPPQVQSPAERAILERLGERREEIQQKGRELEMRERLIENAERRLESRLNELKGAEERAGEAAGKRGDSEAAAIRNLVTMYEAMKPKDAARVFDRLPHDVLVPVATQMNPRKMAEVLSAMSPEAAEKLTVALATRARALTPQPAQPAPAALPPTELPAIDPPPKPRGAP